MLRSSRSRSTEANLKAGVEWCHVGIMMLVAAYLRFPGLGDLSFYGDEEYSALAVRGIWADGYPHMPSGMAYWRGAPYSFLAAGAALLFGLSEFSIRLPSAVFGVLTVPIFYVLAKRHLSLIPAGIASWLFVFSAWHIDMSREGRFYAMFLAFFLLSLLCFQRGFLDGDRRFLWLSVVIGSFTVMLHEISVILILFWALAFVLETPRIETRKSVPALLAAVTVFACWFVYRRIGTFVYPGQGGSSEEGASLGLLRKLFYINFTPKFWMVSDILINHTLWYFGLAALAVAWVAWVWKTEAQSGELRVTFMASSATLYTLAVLNLFGVIASIALVWMLIEGKRIVAQIRPRTSWMTLAGVTGILMFWGLYGLLVWRGRGLELQSQADVLKKVAKDCIYYPALHIAMYYEAFPHMTIAVLMGTLLWITLYCLGRGSGQQEAPLFAWFWIPLLALGITREWTALRYTLPVYPFFVMIFAWVITRVLAWGSTLLRKAPLMKSLSWPAHSEMATVALSACLLLVPFLNEEHGVHHGLAMSRLSYNDRVSPLLHGFPFHPDHKGPGEYVKANVKPNDIVIAIDAFQQAYYVGKVDYWLREESEVKPFLYRENDRWHDIYTNAALMNREELLSLIVERRAQRVWLITSGELPGYASNFLPLALLNSATPSGPWCVFTGRDHESRVYLFPATA